jgi:hypothetical protein
MNKSGTAIDVLLNINMDTATVALFTFSTLLFHIDPQLLTTSG